VLAPDGHAPVAVSGESVKRTLKAAVILMGLVLAAGAWGIVSLLQHGLSAREHPPRSEAFVARHLRHIAVPRAARDAANPASPTPEALARARSHFADHCASCHGNDGRGRTTLGENLYPKAPDMTLAGTQGLSDGEIFYIIENGVRFTGMPAWGEAGVHDTTESWELVQFIRHLPKITAQELVDMEALNPKTRRQFEEDEERRKFLAGEGDQPTAREKDRRR
jgi:mono/diheme cytochrome c family protein